MKATEERVNGGVSRRSFIKGLATAGASIAFLSAGLKSLKADPWGPAFGDVDLPDDKLIDMQRKMLRMRWFTRTMFDTYLTEKWVQDRRPECHPVAGHEATIIGAVAALNDNDWVQGYHRSWGHSIAKGASLNALAAEAINFTTGTNKGFGGSLHIMVKDLYMLGEDGVVGPAIILGAGAAYGVRAQGTGQIVMGFAGEGTIATPYTWIPLHEAAKHKLPWVLVIENNGYQGSKDWRVQSPMTNWIDIAAGLREVGMNTRVVDGMDILEVYSVAKEAVDRARAGDGPSIVECKCYRYYDHNSLTGAQPGRLGAWGLAYRSDRELMTWLAKDPCATFRRTLVAWGVLTEAQADALEQEVIQECKDAIEFAKNSPVPKPEDNLTTVFPSGDVKILPRQLADCPLY